MHDLLLPLAVLLAWIVLNRWVLPWFGVPTCMSGGCGTARCSAGSAEARVADENHSTGAP